MGVEYSCRLYLGLRADSPRSGDAPTRADLATALRSRFSGLRAGPARTGVRWYGVDFGDEGDWRTLERTASELSSELDCDAVALELAEGFDMALFSRGERVRHVAFDPGDGWVRASGEPLPWEWEAFFAGDDLANADEDALAHELGAASPAFRAYTTGALVEGSMHPTPSRVGAKVTEALALPAPRETADFRIGPPKSSAAELLKVVGIGLGVIALVALAGILLGLLVDAVVGL
ncbi:MAG TPA: hypothetical protein RMH99_32450 [Sandaracinaceae bacterium LLY-WYZ-13_1]|nr:hypothetical protein [Sandaracinaceae bacterium LLY-WYZ-13_1]